MFQSAMMQDHNLSLSGGSDAVTFNTSLGFFDQNSTLKGPASYKRYTFNGGFQGKKGIFAFGGKTALTKSNKNNLAITGDHAVFGGGVTSMLTAIPTMPVYDSKRLGGFGGSDATINRAITLNVIGMNSLVTDKSDRDRMLTNVWGEIEIIKNLKYKINGSYDKTNYENYHFEPQFDMGFYYLNTNYILSDNRGVSDRSLLENILSYSFTQKKHKVDLLVGNTYEALSNSWVTGRATDSKEIQFRTFNSIPDNNVKTLSGAEDETRLNSYLARVNYNFNDRILLTFNGRRDGSSNFGPANKYGNFGSAAAAWNLHNEKFIPLPESISTLKLRAGYGVLGNQAAAGVYGYQSFVNANASYVFNNVLNAGATVVGLADPALKWEETTTSNVAMDLGLFNDRLLFSAEYYTRKSTDIITRIGLPLSVGAFPSDISTNAATLQNKGIEFTLAYKNDSRKFKYDFSANAGSVKNKVIKLGATNNPIYGAGSKTEVGGEVGQLFGHVVEGIFQTAAEVTAHAVQPGAAPGDIKFKDLNKDGKINDADDRTYLGSVIPKFNGGINLGASYLNFDMSMFFQGSYGNKVFNGVYRDLMVGQYGNHSVDAMNFWTPTNKATNIPRPVILDPNGNGRFSDRFVESGSYTRLQNMQIGYTIPKSALLRLKAVSNLRAYISGQNLFTITKYKGYDPDFISDGLFSRGFDYGSFPNSRVFMFGLQVGL
jgi:TonB-linked SusC/RagA family outer membrane protein